MARRVRGLCQVVLLVLLVACVGRWGDMHASGSMGSGGCLIDPSRCVGSEQVFSLVSVSRAYSDGSVEVAIGRRTLRVTGLSDDIDVGARVSFGGVFRAQPLGVHATWSERSEGQSAKHVLALVVIGLFGLSAPWWLRREAKGWCLRG